MTNTNVIDFGRENFTLRTFFHLLWYFATYHI